eukprot:jgi/Botrbrau1/1285/Bobra.0063s0002.1
MGSVYSSLAECSKSLWMLGIRLGVVRPSATAMSGSKYIMLDGGVVLPKVQPRMVSTSAALQTLRSVKNARDLAEACSTIAPGRIFRSACPTDACEHDITVLRETLGVKHLVDLRSEEELRKDRDRPLLMEGAEVRKFGSATGQVETYVRKGNGGQLPALTVHHVSLLERRKYEMALLKRMPFSTVAYVVFWKLVDDARARAAAIRVVNEGGLPGLYECILETSGPELRHILETISGTVETGSPTMFFCKIGKDRTGLVAALILAACGASDAEIVSDYVRSDDHHGLALGGIESEKEILKGLDVEAFSRAPREAMLKTLQHVGERYGGLRGYLDSIGFDRDAQMRLAQRLAPPHLESQL